MFGYKKIVSKYERFLFISPHLDDAVLSCGQFLPELAKLKKSVTVVTVFTKASAKTISPQAKSFLKKCGAVSAIKFFRNRKKEDTAALHYLHVNSKHLNFIDAAWRLDKDKRPIYANENIQFSGTIKSADKSTVLRIRSQLNKLIANNKQTLLLCPLGIGGHADHVIIKEVIKKIPGPKLFWEDYPYNTNKKLVADFLSHHKFVHRAFRFYGFDFRKKETAIRLYSSQIKSLFPANKIPHLSESYYFEEKAKPY